MDGGQVALNIKGTMQASVWMSDSAGSRKLFFVITKTGESPASAPPAELDGQQTHASVLMLEDERALGVWEQDGNSVRAAVLGKDGKLGSPVNLGQGKYPRLVAVKDGAIAVWESDSGIKLRKLSAEELK